MPSEYGLFLVYESLRKSVVHDLLVLAERQPKIAWGILLIIPEQLPPGDIYEDDTDDPQMPFGQFVPYQPDFRSNVVHKYLKADDPWMNISSVEKIILVDCWSEASVPFHLVHIQV